MAERTASAFSLRYSVEATVPAAASVVWGLLTDAAGFPSWNSTVTSIEGDIALGNRLAIRVPISPRTFRPRVVEFEAEKRMVWQDGALPMFRGRRTFTLSAKEDATVFSMVEEFTGLMVGPISKSLPDFGPVFDQYAADLVAAARKRS